MKDINFRKAKKSELRTILYHDPLATNWDKAAAQTELNRRKEKRLSGRVDKHAGVRR